jgi:hypothetical protein
VAAVAAVVVVDRAVRSAGNSVFGLSDDRGRGDAAPIISGSIKIVRSGFTPKSALPIIAPLGGGTLNWLDAVVNGPSGAFCGDASLKRPRGGLFR